MKQAEKQTKNVDLEDTRILVCVSPQPLNTFKLPAASLNPPDAPDVPDAPDAPGVPGAPDAPGVPDVPPGAMDRRVDPRRLLGGRRTQLENCKRWIV